MRTSSSTQLSSVSHPMVRQIIRGIPFRRNHSRSIFHHDKLSFEYYKPQSPCVVSKQFVPSRNLLLMRLTRSLLVRFIQRCVCVLSQVFLQIQAVPSVRICLCRWTTLTTELPTGADCGYRPIVTLRSSCSVTCALTRSIQCLDHAAMDTK